MRQSIRRLAILALALGLVAGSTARVSAADLRGRLYAAFARVHSYKVTVLGSVRSTGVWVAPNRYRMTTELEGKPVETVIVGHDYWTLSGTRWERSGTASHGLDVDISGLLRVAKQEGGAFTVLPDQTQDGKRVGTFSYTFRNGTDETCNFDRATYLVSRCKADELTLLYSGYNDPANSVPAVK